ncbi:MAG: MaoC family dehydratase [Deferrisomatales bacterium]|nr:MaoC family dehydratase [Deferrisomatales bacterium]
MEYRLTTFDDLCLGQRASFSKTVTEADLSHFVAITGDVNPLHVDQEFARRTFFGERIAHGMLSAALFSTLVGMLLPGIGAIYRSQTLEFLRPARIGDTLTANFEVERLDPVENLIEMRSWVENQKGEVVVRGRACASLLRGLCS